MNIILLGKSLIRLQSNNNCLKRSIATLPRAITEITHPDDESTTAKLDTINRLRKYTVTLSNRPTVVFTHGKGCHLYDANDRAYLDFTAGISINTMGYADPIIARDLQTEAQKLVYTSNLYYDSKTSLLAEKLAETTNIHSKQDWASKVFLNNSAAESNEGALKFARKWGKVVGGEKKSKLVCFRNAFHGRSTMGALSVTPDKQYQAPYAPLISDIDVLEFNNEYEVLHEVDETTAGVIVEPIQGKGGVNVASAEFMKALRDRCTQTNALLIFDEVQCGLGRTGKLWAHQLYERCNPDILTMAEPLANGLHIGAIITSDKVAETIRVDDHDTLFGANPLAAAVAISVVERASNKQLLRNVDEVSHSFVRDLKALQEEYPEFIKEVRGEGLLLGVEFFDNPAPLIKLSRERGLLLSTADNNTIRIIPPLTLSKAEAREGIARLSGAIEVFLSRKN